MNDTTTPQPTGQPFEAITFWPGDFVKMSGNDRRFAGYWQVDRVNPKTISLSSPDGRKVKAHHSFLLALTDDERTEARATFYKALTEQPAPQILHPGATVSLRGKDGVYVVLKTTPRGYSVALLGGENGRYWNCPETSLTAITVTTTVTA